MENQVQIFENPEFGEIRTVEIDGEPWLVLVDVCRALDIENSRNVARRLDGDELTSIKCTSGGQMRKLNVINESGLYSVILRSDKPEAKTFKRWVTHEVLPSIRKTGAYQAAPVIDANRMAGVLAMVSNLADLMKQTGAEPEAIYDFTREMYREHAGIELPDIFHRELDIHEAVRTIIARMRFNGFGNYKIRMAVEDICKMIREPPSLYWPDKQYTEEAWLRW